MKLQYCLILLILIQSTMVTTLKSSVSPYQIAAQTLQIQEFQKEVQILPDCQKQEIMNQLPDWLLPCSDPVQYKNFVLAIQFSSADPAILLKKILEWQKFAAFREIVGTFKWHNQANILIAQLKKELQGLQSKEDIERIAFLEETLKNIVAIGLI